MQVNKIKMISLPPKKHARSKRENTCTKTANHAKCGSNAIAKTCFCQHKLTSTGARGCLKIIEDNSTCHISTQLHANYTIFHNLIQASYALAKVGHEIKRLDLISNHFKWFHVLASSTTSCGLSSSLYRLVSRATNKSCRSIGQDMS